MTSGLPDWGRVHGQPLATARLRAAQEDFDVTEELGFVPGEDGAHLFLLVEKTGQNTAWVAQELARAAAVPLKDVGYSGMKDRHAVTRQWFSVPDPGGKRQDLIQFCRPGVRVLRLRRNARKLRRGVHLSNRFVLRLRDFRGDRSQVSETLASLAQRGFPNYFGEQRFGRNASNLELASRLFAGSRLRRNKRSLALSAARSLIFNACLSARVEQRSWDRLLDGDIANLDGSGSVFKVDTVTDDLAARALSFDLHPTGPLWGDGAPQCAGDPAVLEQAAADQYPEYRDGLVSNTRAARRPLRAQARSMTWAFDASDLCLEFTLQRGAFATALLRELVDWR